METTVRVRVRFSEVDPLGIVWHGNYVKYLEDAREQFGREWGLSYKEIFAAGYYAPVFDMHLRFEQTVRTDDVILVTCRWRREVGAKLCFEYEIRREDDKSLVLTASSIQLFTTVDGVFEPSVPEFYKKWKEEADG